MRTLFSIAALSSCARHNAAASSSTGAPPYSITAPRHESTKSPRGAASGTKSSGSIATLNATRSWIDAIPGMCRRSGCALPPERMTS